MGSFQEQFEAGGCHVIRAVRWSDSQGINEEIAEIARATRALHAAPYAIISLWGLIALEFGQVGRQMASELVSQMSAISLPQECSIDFGWRMEVA
ncbi:11484_t:CDS:2, partial [Acaulospora colombiana]